MINNAKNHLGLNVNEHPNDQELDFDVLEEDFDDLEEEDHFDPVDIE